MKKTIYLCYILVIIMIGNSGCENMENRKKSLNHVNIIKYDKGKSLTYELDNATELISLIDSLFLNCNDIYEIIVTEKLIENLKKNETCFEFIFPGEHEMKSSKLKTYSVKQLLIPISGRYASSNQVTFFCGYPKYSSGPLVNKDGMEAFIGGLIAAGIFK